MVALIAAARPNTVPPAISSGRWPIRAASLPKRGARNATSSGPVVRAKPASSVEKPHASCRNSTLPRNIAANAAPKISVAPLAAPIVLDRSVAASISGVWWWNDR
jgi:hypothetical protein